MKHWFLVAALVGGTLAVAQEGRITGFNSLFFDASGRATEKLTGNIVGMGATMRLSEAMVEFLDPAKPGAAPSGRLLLDEAIFAQKEQTVAGVGELRFRSPEGNITGKGYRYEADGDRFTIRDGFRFELAEGTVEGREADVTLGRVNGDVVIATFEGRGSIVFTPKNPEEFKVERVEGNRAWYAATDGMLRIASPLRRIYKSNTSVSEFETFEYKLNLKR